MRLKPFFKFMTFISLCHLSHLSLVRPILKNDVQLLGNKFIDGYWAENKVLYMFPLDQNGNTINIGSANT
jgi:hypothetical protein